VERIIKDMETLRALPVGAKFRDRYGHRYVRIIGGIACREQCCKENAEFPNVFPYEEAALPAELVHLPEIA